MDFRFEDSHNKWIKSLEKCDRVALAGASKAVVDEDTSKAALKQIALANKLHGVDTVYLVDHEDCGGYGSKAACASDKEEMEIHATMAKKAKEIIEDKFSDIKVFTKIAMLDGKVLNL
jgi:carbonic anhydrase